MSDAIPINPPLKVMLRNKSIALLTHGLPGQMFQLHGHLEGSTLPEAWKRRGHYCEDNKPHDLDIILLEQADGHWLNFQIVDVRMLKAKGRRK